MNMCADVKKHLNVLPALMNCKISTERVSNKMALHLLKVSIISTQLFGAVPLRQISYSA
jgi:high-affinity K+ transport system ATPase subunit B